MPDVSDVPFRKIDLLPFFGASDLLRRRDEIDDYHFRNGVSFSESDLGMLAFLQALCTTVAASYLWKPLEHYLFK